MVDCEASAAPDAVRIAAIRHHLRKPPANPELALGFSQEQQTSIGQLVTTLKINCELLAFRICSPSPVCMLPSHASSNMNATAR